LPSFCQNSTKTIVPLAVFSLAVYPFSVSYKIHNGYRLPFTTLRALFAWRERLCRKFEETCPARLNMVLAERAVRVIDQQIAMDVFPSLAGPRRAFQTSSPNSRNILSALFFDLHDELKWDPVKRNLNDDFELSVTVHFSKTRHGEHILCLLHSNSTFISEWFHKHSGAKHFPYWTSHDKPDSLTDAAWRARGCIWKAAILHTPKESGFSISSKDPALYLYNKGPNPPPLPSKSKRAEETVKNILLHHKLLQLPKDCESWKYFETIQRFSTPKTMKRVHALAALLEKYLPDFPTWNSIQNHPVRLQSKTANK